MSEITQPRSIGITAQAASASTQLTKGASRNTPLLAPEGMIGSFSTNFRRSAKDCSRPQGPTTLGPRLICTPPHTLRPPKRPHPPPTRTTTTTNTPSPPTTTNPHTNPPHHPPPTPPPPRPPPPPPPPH